MTPQQRRVLWAVYQHCKDNSAGPEGRLLCYSWIIRGYEKRFGERFHQAELKNLEKQGYLRLGDSARGDHRRYYTLINPAQIVELVKELDPVQV